MNTKFYISLFAFVLFVPSYLFADKVPGAILSQSSSGKKILTFTYVDENAATALNGELGTYELNTGDETPGWINDTITIDRVFFNSSFAKARPTSTYKWFSRLGGSCVIKHLEYLNTSEVTNMSWMFGHTKTLTNKMSLDLSHFDTRNVTDMSHMFEECYLTSLDLSNFDTRNVTDMNNMFYMCYYLTSLDLSSFDTRNVTDMSRMFDVCYHLPDLDLSNFDTRNVTDMSWMFCSCSNLTSLDLSSFDTRNVTDMMWMFRDCSNLTSLDLSSFDTRNVKCMEEMFKDCSSLTSLDLSAFDTRNVTDMGHMFEGCSSLTSLDLSNFDIPSSTTQILYGCFRLKSLSIGNNDTCFGGSDFYNVGSSSNPCYLKIGDNFDRQVLGSLIEGIPSYYWWSGGCFTLTPIPTDVERVVSSNLDNSTTPIYNLAGQRVDNDYKGIVIINGKKVLRK